MKRIAICGNIASGKSTVQNIIESKGYKVLDTDVVSHKLLTVNNKALYSQFKDYDVFENGEFSREKVGKLIFSEKDLREKINSIMHPQIEEKIKEFYKANKDEDFIFVAIPLLFEAKMEYLFDKIIFISADDKIRLDRLLKRNNYTLKHANDRINSQMSQDEKIKKSDIIIENNGSIEELKQRIEDFINFNLV